MNVACAYCAVRTEYSDAFEKLRKTTVSFIMSVRLTAWNNSAPTGRIFMKFDIGAFFDDLSRKFNFH